MSEENIEIVRAGINALQSGDKDAVLKDAAPDFELDFSRAAGPIHGVYRLDQVREVLDELFGIWESVRFEAEKFIEAGENVVVPITTHARGREGIEVQTRVTWLYTIRDGAIVRACMYQERREALEAAGLRE